MDDRQKAILQDIGMTKEQLWSSVDDKLKEQRQRFSYNVQERLAQLRRAYDSPTAKSAARPRKVPKNQPRSNRYRVLRGIREVVSAENVETSDSDDEIKTEVSSEDQDEDEAEVKEMKENFLAVSDSDDESGDSEDYTAENGVEEDVEADLAALDTEEEEDSEIDNDEYDDEMMDLD